MIGRLTIFDKQLAAEIYSNEKVTLVLKPRDDLYDDAMLNFSRSRIANADFI